MRVRELKSIADFDRCLDLQKKAWDFADIDIVPIPLFVLARDYGGIVLGAEMNDELIGFVYSIPVRHQRKIIQHSHMLAVLPPYQNRGIGYKLKLAQREQAIRMDYDLITWTADPLQSKNNYLNFRKLGTTARSYLKDYYGMSSSPLHSGIATDRLLIEWVINSERVKKSLAGTTLLPDFFPVLWQEGGEFHTSDKEGVVGIEIPKDVQKIKNENRHLAEEWQGIVRDKLETYFPRGYYIADLVREPKPFLVLAHD